MTTQPEETFSAKPASWQEALKIYTFLIVQGITLLFALGAALMGLLSLAGIGVTFSVPMVYASVYAIGYAITLFGISLWNHRLATHGAGKTHKWLKYIFSACGAMAGQGFFYAWVGFHWEHHGHTDKPCKGKPEGQACDPHTPLDGFWHADRGWLVKGADLVLHPHWVKAETRLAKIDAQFEDAIDEARRSKLIKNRADELDLIENREIMKWFDRTMVGWFLVSLFVPGVITGLFIQSWDAFLIGTLICGFGRMGAVNQATSLVNSYEHMKHFPGNYRHFEGVGANSSNNWWIALFNPEGFHWWHHVFPWSMNHGVYWYERMLDHTANFVWVLEKLGLFWDVRWVTVNDVREMEQKIRNGPAIIAANREKRLRAEKDDLSGDGAAQSST